MGGRHKAPAATVERASLGTRVRAALRRPGRHTPPTGVPAARVWVLAQAAAVAVIVAIAGVLVVLAHVVVDWREPLVGAALLFAPPAVRQVVLGVRHRWPALIAGYVVLFGLGYLVLLGAESLWSSTIGGFLGAAVGVLLCGATFFLISNVRTSRAPAASEPSAEVAVSESSEVSAQADPASEPTGPLPRLPAEADSPTDPFPHLGGDPDTDALPVVHPDEERRAR